MKSFCMKYKKDTPNKNIKTLVENNKNKMISNCKICNSKKSKFIKLNNKKKSNKGVVDTFVNNLPVKLHLQGIFHLELYQNNDLTLKNKKLGTNMKMKFTGLRI